MRGRIDGKRLIFTNFSSDEIDKVRSLLTWPGDEYSETETILFEENGTFFTFWGLYNILKNKVKLEVFGIPDLDVGEFGEVPEDILKGIKLYDFQRAAIRKGLILKRGIEVIPTSGGKTEIILATISILFNSNKISKVLIIVPTVSLVEQFYSRALLRGFPQGSVGRVHGTNQELDCPVIVGTINSLVKGYREGGRIKDFIEKADAAFFDECQHIQAPTWIELAFGITNAQYTLCFSGSPFQNDDDILELSSDTQVYGIAGAPIFSIPLSYLVSLGLVAEPFVFFKSLPGRISKFPGNYRKIYNQGISENSQRNILVHGASQVFKEYGFPTLIPVQLKEHALELLYRLKDPRAIYVSGGAHAVTFDDNANENEFIIDYSAFRESFEAGQYDTLIATKVFGEGIDLPAIQGMIMAGGGGGKRGKISLRQWIGRIIRKKKDKVNRVYCYDFIDRYHVYLYSQYLRRRKLYDELGIKIVDDELTFNRLLASHAEKR
jgi:superfamily II DNA or RNA helicase